MVNEQIQTRKEVGGIHVHSLTPSTIVGHNTSLSPKHLGKRKTHRNPIVWKEREPQFATPHLKCNTPSPHRKRHTCNTASASEASISSLISAWVALPVRWCKRLERRPACKHVESKYSSCFRKGASRLQKGKGACVKKTPLPCQCVYTREEGGFRLNY